MTLYRKKPRKVHLSIHPFLPLSWAGPHVFYITLKLEIQLRTSDPPESASLVMKLCAPPQICAMLEIKPWATSQALLVSYHLMARTNGITGFAIIAEKIKTKKSIQFTT